jgi:hypothetical protein
MGSGVAFAAYWYSPLWTEEVILVGFSLYAIALVIVYAALRAIFVTALYVYANSGSLPPGFRPDYFEGVFALAG